MINFFRKIRKQLADDKKPIKYFRYAIGEIVLIVIGILIALSINNWNQYRIERVEEDNYIYRIIEDLKQDTTYLNNKIKETKRNGDSLGLFYKLMHNKQNSHIDFIRLLQLSNWNPQNVKLQDYTFLEITSSGKFDLIESIELKENIIDYYRFRDFTHEHISETTKNGFDLITKLLPSLARYYNYESLMEYEVFGEDDWGWINNPKDLKFKELEASISQFRYKANISEDYYKQLYTKAEKILMLIASIENR